MSPTRRVFISHAAADAGVVRFLISEIKAGVPGIDVFATTQPGDLSPGREWLQQTLQELGDSARIIVVITRNSVVRPWLWFETGFAWSRHIPILPLCVGGLRPQDVPFPLKARQILNLSVESDARQCFKELGGELTDPTQFVDGLKAQYNEVRLKTLAELRQRSLSRCRVLWEGAGVGADMATLLAADGSLGAPPPVLDAEGQVHIVVARQGAGKSLVAERLYQRALSTAHDPAAAIPIHVDLRRDNGRFRDIIRRDAEDLGDWNQQGVWLIADNIDAVSATSAKAIVEEAWELVLTVPHTTAVLLSRDTGVFAHARERVSLPELEGPQVEALVDRIVGHRAFGVLRHRLPKNVLTSARLPLFAVLLATHVKEGGHRIPRSAAELMRALAERTIRHASGELP